MDSGKFVVLVMLISLWPASPKAQVPPPAWLQPTAAAASVGREATARACAYATMAGGLLKDISDGEEVAFSPDNSFVLVQTPDDAYFDVYDVASLKEYRRRKPAGTRAFIVSERELVVPGTARSTIVDVRSARSRRVASGELTGDVGRPVPFEQRMKGYRVSFQDREVAIERLYSSQYVLKIYPASPTVFAQFRADVLNGIHCGTPLPKAGARWSPASAGNARFMVWDDLTSGSIATLAALARRKTLVERLFSRKEIDELLEAYAYRITEDTRSSPLYARIDPDKFWCFAWASAARMFRSKEFVDFTDLSAFQRNGLITFAIFGTQPIPGVAENEYGFHLQVVHQEKVQDIASVRHLDWTWKQAGSTYTASFVLQPPQAAIATRHAAFPKGITNGLVILDATIDGEDATELLTAYLSYYKAAGFTFQPRRRIAGLKSYLSRLIRGRFQAEYLVREGHADGDDENLLSLTAHGSALLGVKRSADGIERVAILLHRPSSKSADVRVSYKEFAAWVRASREERAKPFVYLNTSCWGLEKTWFGLGFMSSSDVIEIAPTTPSNFFDNGRDSAIKAIIDGMRAGDTFAKVRADLLGLDGFRTGVADRYVFPDERGYPHRTGIVRIERSITVEKRGRRIRYNPNGYI